MARLTSSGFELGTATQGVEFSNTSGGPTVVRTTVRSGNFAGRISSLVSATVQRFFNQFATSNTGGNGPYFGRIYLNVAVFPSAENRMMGFVNTNSGAFRAYITLDSSGLLRLYNGAGTQIGSSADAILLGGWYRIELRVDRTAAAGSQVIEARVGGIVFATSSTQTITTDAGDTLVIGGNLGSEAQTTGDWFFDDVAVNNGSGSFQNTYPGEGSIIHLRPNAAGDSTQWTPDTGVNFARVNEITPDTATSTVSDSLASKTDFYNIDNVPPNCHPSSTISLVCVGGQFNNPTADATTSFQFQLEKAPSGTILQSSAITPNSTTWKVNSATSAFPIGYPIVTYQDPDNISWTVDTLNQVQIGVVTGTIGVFGIQLSTIWALIEYLPLSSLSNYGKYIGVGDGVGRSEVAN